ncbi:hypothetical protein [Brachybacterium sp. FME24]|uniref:hypothetical protein n=1 Tax=Brachybacterium sp. FME24 TaxID=2742605 RepID=UPI001868FA50|nr:hypothetical protein [Brachybacterium sp. FME24]
MEAITYPDPKAALIGFLNGVLDVPAYSRVPNERPASFVRVLLAGGEGGVDGFLSDVAFTVESWDNNESAAQARAQRIRGHLRGAYLMGGHPVYGYKEWGPPVDLADASLQWRYTFTFAIRFRPV